MVATSFSSKSPPRLSNPPPSTSTSPYNTNSNKNKTILLSPGTPEYNNTLYTLELSLSPLQVTPTDVKIWKVADDASEKVKDFTRRSKNKRALPSFEDVTVLQDDQLQTVINDGLYVSENGRDVINGAVEIRDKNVKQGDVITLLLLDVIVGKSSIIDDNSVNVIGLSPGYDSYHLKVNVPEKNAKEIEKAKYQNQTHFRTFSSNNLSIKHIVRFNYTDESNVNLNPLLSQDNGKKVDVYDRIDFFDIELWKGVSLRDKMSEKKYTSVADDTTTITDKNKTVSIEEIYASTLEKMIKPNNNASVNNTKKSLQKSLETVTNKIKSINNNTKSAEDQILQSARNALSQLKVIKDSKLNVLNEYENEILRKIAHVTLNDEHLNKKKLLSSPVDFLRIYDSHKKCADGLCFGVVDDGEVMDACDVGVRVSGGLEVACGDERVSVNAASTSTESDYSNSEINTTSSKSTSMSKSKNATTNTSKAKKPHSSLSPKPRTARIDFEAEDPTQIYVSVSENLKVADRFKQYSLSGLATMKKKMLSATLDSSLMFNESRILSSVQQAETLFYNLPFVSKAMSTHMVFQSIDCSNPNISMVHHATKTSAATVLIIKSGDYVFGGYASTPWSFDNTPFGSARCFLFSLTLDLKIPYTGRSRDLITESKIVDEGGVVNHHALIAGEGYTQFGIAKPGHATFGSYGDLCLEGDFSCCSSVIEQSYGLGLKENCREACTLLAGSTAFKVDFLEVYAIEGGVVEKGGGRESVMTSSRGGGRERRERGKERGRDR